MEDSEPYQNIVTPVLDLQPAGFDFNAIVLFAIVVLLLFISALISGSELALFSVFTDDSLKQSDKKNRTKTLIGKLLRLPERLIATIIIGTYLLNVSIVIISFYSLLQYLTLNEITVVTILLFIAIVFFLILFVGDILPKVLVNRYPGFFIRLASPILRLFLILFWPLSAILIKSTKIVNRRMSQKKVNLSMNELSDALDLTQETLSEEKNILKGIVKFSNIYVSEIMQSRINVLAVDFNTTYPELLKVINESGYSRVPVYSETFDDIKGILYIKDLLLHLDKPSNFKWQSLIRPPYFVPESKKINDLLKEFQTRHIHMAIVVDEYGGTSGIITLEDILEEIVGEISDESDADEPPYKIIDENNILFEGRVLLNDFYKIANVNDNVFDKIKGEADTLAGLILEIKGEIPKAKDKITYSDFKFEIKEVDKRRIKSIHVSIKRNDN